MDSNNRIAEIKEFWVPALKMHMEIGWTAPVEELLLKFQPFLANSGNAKLISIFQMASVWLEMAKQKECLEGKDCLLNKEHKYYKIFL